MNIKRLISLVLVTFLIFFSATPVSAKSSDIQDFKGERNIIFSVDASDLENFVNGGRSAFELSVRKTRPEWLDVKINTVDRDVYVSLYFQFENFMDYLDKVSSLLTFEPAIVFETEGGLTFIEGFSTSSLVNFIVYSSKTSNITDEFSPYEFFDVKTNNITINGTLYEQKNTVCITSEATEPVRLDELKISTSLDENLYTRKIFALINKENMKRSDVKAITHRFESIGETVSEETDENYNITVNFTASGQNELILKTIKCLYVSTSISESQVFIEDNMVGVTRREEIDWDNLRHNEESFISNSFVFPEYYTKLKSRHQSTKAGTNDIYSEDAKTICYYEREFMFDSITVTTDFSSLLPKTDKTITFTTPTYIAVNFHEKIINALSGRLKRGCTFNVYDFGEMRYYEISFSSWAIEDISDTMSSITDSKYSCQQTISLIPFAANNYSEKGSIKSFVNSNSIANNIIYIYSFSEYSDIPDYKSADAFSLKFQNSLFVFSGNEKISVNIKYRTLGLLKPIFIFIVIAIVVFLGFSISRKVKKLKKRLSHKKAYTQASKKSVPDPVINTPKNTRNKNTPPVRPPERTYHIPQKDVPVKPKVQSPSVTKRPEPPTDKAKVVYCKFCGTPIKSTSSFCRNCGAKLK